MLSVRELQQSDIDLIADYWLQSDSDYLISLGVDLSKLPTREVLTNMLSSQLSLPVEQRRAYCIIWEQDGEAIGHCNTNPTQFGEEANMHLHLWKRGARQKGIGSQLVVMTLPYFFHILQLKRLYCEPYALNDAPNKTLARVGFEFEKEYTTIPGSLNFEQPVKRWVMTQERFNSLYQVARDVPTVL